MSLFTKATAEDAIGCPCLAYPDQPVSGLKLLGSVQVVVDEPETNRLAASELGAEPEHEDGRGVPDFVQLGQLLLQLSLVTSAMEIKQKPSRLDTTYSFSRQSSK